MVPGTRSSTFPRVFKVKTFLLQRTRILPMTPGVVAVIATQITSRGPPYTRAVLLVHRLMLPNTWTMPTANALLQSTLCTMKKRHPALHLGNEERAMH